MNPALDETTGHDYQHPRDPAEIWLARQWQDVLGFAVGIRENFFGVGGNSLDAARIIDAVLADFGIQLPLNILTERPTIERLATLLRSQAEPLPEQLSGPLLTIQDGDPARPPLFLIHPDHGQATPYCHLARTLGEDYTVHGLQAAGLYSPGEPRRTISAMAAAYTAAIQAARPAGPYLLGGAAIGAAIACQIATQLGDVQLLAVIDPALLEPPGTSPVPPDAAPGFAARSQRVQQANHDATRNWHPAPYPGTIDIFGPPPGTALPATQRCHQCTTTEQLADALRELLG